MLWLHIATRAKELDPRIGLPKASNEATASGHNFYKASESDPKNDLIYQERGWIYESQGQFAQAEASFKKSLELNPRNSVAYVRLGEIYENQGRFTLAAACFEKALEFTPRDERLYAELGRIDKQRGQLKQAARWLRKGLNILGPRAGYRLYGELAAISERRGQIANAREYYDKASRLALDSSASNDSPTARNYRALKAMLDKRKIRLVCVQYPMRPAASLKKIFAGQWDDIIFVDNESVFRDAVRQTGHNAYFRDMFAGDFGHCTEKGNRLLGENIAKAILKEMLGK